MIKLLLKKVLRKGLTLNKSRKKGGNMKRILATILIAVFSLLAVPVRASITDLSLSYSYTNDTGAEVWTYVSTSTIEPGIHKIMGFDITPTPQSDKGIYAGLYDATAAAHLLLTNLFGEAETDNTSSTSNIFPYPKRISRGVGMIIGPFTTVTVHYAR
jgi:hypothetical protein